MVAAMAVQAPGDEPVWRQLLRRYLSSNFRKVAQQAAAGPAGPASPGLADHPD
jgi:hypothetical protein